MENGETKIMTVDEIASYLRIPRSSVYKLAQEGKIPAQKVGKHWRFHRDTVELWMSNQLDDSMDTPTTDASCPKCEDSS